LSIDILENLNYISKFPEFLAFLPSYFSEETALYGLYKYFKEIGGFFIRAEKIRGILLNFYNKSKK